MLQLSKPTAQITKFFPYSLPPSTICVVSAIVAYFFLNHCHEKAPTQFPPSLLISFSILQSPLIDGSMNNFKNNIKERVVLQQIVLFTISSRYGYCRSVTSFVELHTDDRFCSTPTGHSARFRKKGTTISWRVCYISNLYKFFSYEFLKWMEWQGFLSILNSCYISSPLVLDFQCIFLYICFWVVLVCCIPPKFIQSEYI